MFSFGEPLTLLPLGKGIVPTLRSPSHFEVSRYFTHSISKPPDDILSLLDLSRSLDPPLGRGLPSLFNSLFLFIYLLPWLFDHLPKGGTIQQPSLNTFIGNDLRLTVDRKNISPYPSDGEGFQLFHL
ncbi:hypothetical protein CEXT_439191 [Caerostris extrusa]|uniref:Uncharacterized protein n=1 Tax=Caerostris extrusa TaxID=172846 RepID=A0AAV4N2C8_CAEEX|nr:hypothetical protein CEXT_439191 [Caerostris extrusa]